MTDPAGQSVSAPDSPQALFGAPAAARVRFAGAAAEARLAPLLRGGAAPAGWTLVKQNVARSVFRVDANGVGVFYLKHFHNPSPLHRLQRRMGWSDAVRELRFSRYLAERGVPVLDVLAACCRDGVEWLVSAAIEPAVPADVWHAQRLAVGDHAAIDRAAVELAGIIGRMHACGVIHHDLHCGNILVCTEAAGAPEAGGAAGRLAGEAPRLVLMDLHRMSRRPWLSRNARAANLAQLLNDRLPTTTRAQRVRFLKRYIEASGAKGTLRGWIRLVEPHTWRHSRGLYAQRERRIFGDNRYFARVRPAGYRGHVVLASKRRVPGSAASALAFRAEDWQRALADPEALFTGPDVQIVKDSRSSLVVRRKLRVGPHELDVYIKRPRRKKARRLILDFFRLSRPLRAFHLGHALLARHIHTALPLAAMEKRVGGGFLVDSILITDAVGDSLHLNKFFKQHLGDGPRPPGAPAEEPRGLHQSRPAQLVLWQLGRIVRRLHEEGFAHRDLKATNLLVHWNGPPAVPEVVLIDLDGLARVRRVTRRQQFRGLMRLNVSLLQCPGVTHAGRLRMLLGYLRQDVAAGVNYKPYWRVLQRWSAAKLRRQIASRQQRQKAVRRSEP